MHVSDLILETAKKEELELRKNIFNIQANMPNGKSTVGTHCMNTLINHSFAADYCTALIQPLYMYVL